MASSPARWPSRFLTVTVVGLAGGTLAALRGAGAAADALWTATALVGLALAVAGVVGSLRRRSPGVDVVAVLALVGAVAVGQQAAAAVIAVMVASGSALEGWAASRAERDLRALVDRAPAVAHRVTGDDPDGGDGAGAGHLVTVPVDEVEVGDRLVVRPGESVPVDGRLLSPTAVLDTATLTGESVPAVLAADDVVRSGTVNAGDPFTLRAIATAEASSFAHVIRLVEHARTARPPFVRLADRLALVFVPAVLVVTGLTWWLSGSSVQAVAVLVVATPCPLILAAPVALVSGVSRAARRGLLVKDAGVLERLATAKVLVFDKTGTVTRGRPDVVDVVTAPGAPPGFAAEVLRLAASLEQVSAHVLADAVVRAHHAARVAAGAGVSTSPAPAPALLSWPIGAHETVGQGVEGVVEGHRVRIGRLAWLLDEDGGGAEPAAAELPPWVRAVRRRVAVDAALTMFVAVDGEVTAALVLEDRLRTDAARTVRNLRAAGLERLIMATGDRTPVAEALGAVLGVDEILAEQSPGQKVDVVVAARRRGPTVMVGDGVNDAPALAAADVGVALGATAAGATADLADVVLTVDRLDRLVDGLSVSRRAVGIARQSVLAGMGLSLAAMGVAAFGWLPPLAGAVTQEAIDVAVILNALRVLAWRPHRSVVGPEDAVLARRLAGEHTELAAGIAGLRELADDLDDLAADEGPPSPAARERLEAARRFLVDELLTHEAADEHELYPVVARAIGGDDPTGAMSRAHAEIAVLVRAYGALVDEIAAGGWQPGDRREVRRLLYGLDAVLRVHFAQEEAYLLVTD